MLRYITLHYVALHYITMRSTVTVLCGRHTSGDNQLSNFNVLHVIDHYYHVQNCVFIFILLNRFCY